MATGVFIVLTLYYYTTSIAGVFSNLVSLYVMIRIIGPAIGFVIGLIFVIKYYKDASLFFILMTISFWTSMGAAIGLIIFLAIYFVPSIPLPGINPVYLLTAMLIIAGVTGPLSLWDLYRRLKESEESENIPLDKVEEGEEAIHVMQIGDEPSELPPDERGEVEEESGDGGSNSGNND